MAKIEIIAKIPTYLQLDKSDISQIVNTSLSQLRANGDMIVEVGFLRSKKIETLNSEYRGIAEPTDVLSFPQGIINKSSRQILGSIVICPEIVGLKKEKISDVIKHGVLHLLDYDHEKNVASWEKAAKIISCGL